MKLKYTLIFLLLIPVMANAVRLEISIFNDFQKKEVVFSSLSGKYLVKGNQSEGVTILKEDIVRVVQIDDSTLSLYKGEQQISKSSEIHFIGSGFMKAFSIRIADGPTNIRDYDDDLIIRIRNGKIQLINLVDLEHYTAGVVQSEALGSSKDLQFFFVQAITCRTYALVNYLKHSVEEFNLCDGVHCQYYSGRCRSADISRATARTSGNVIVDQDKRMISAAFHSNCGGHTINSENVWSIATSYLKAVNDTFCLHKSNSIWTYTMSKDDWLQFLKNHYNYPIENPKMRIKAYTYQQPVRQINFEYDIPLKDIRRDLKLRSTFFSLESRKDSVVFHGRGYGHGVGLCQQGAIQMADLGMDYKDIVRFYYANTEIIHFSELRYDFMP